MNCDLFNLKRYDVLRAYCEEKLGPVVEHGSYAMCACPFGRHQRHEHLNINNKEGIGLAHCFACEGAGTVLDVAAAVMGVNIREKGMFLKVAQHVAEVTNTPLNITSGRGTRGKSEMRPSASRPKYHKRVTSTPAKVEYLEEANERIAFAAVDYAHNTPELMQVHAEMLGLPLDSLMRHTNREDAGNGLLGLTPDGRLLYVYTLRDAAGIHRVVAVKLRGDNTGYDSMSIIRYGQWRSGGLMHDKNGNPRRFIFSAGKAGSLYGADALQGHYMALLTEGESDKLALDYVLDTVRAELLNNADSPEEGLTEEDIPIAIAKASAGTFKSEWAAQLSGKAVIIIADADEAGRKGAEATAAKLHAAGAMDVHMWTPPIGCKDVREMVTKSPPLEVFENIMNHSELIN